MEEVDLVAAGVGDAGREDERAGAGDGAVEGVDIVAAGVGDAGREDERAGAGHGDVDEVDLVAAGVGDAGREDERAGEEGGAAVDLVAALDAPVVEAGDEHAGGEGRGSSAAWQVAASAMRR